MKKHLFILVVSTILLVSASLSADKLFGTWCQKKFDNNWCTEITSAWDHCGRFNDELDGGATKVFYFQLGGAKPLLEETSDLGWTEQVDLVYIHTHGAEDDDNGYWAMRDDHQWAYSSLMGLGNEGRGLQVFASFACHTHRLNDNRFVNRWVNIFKGGLKYTMGSHGTLHQGPDTDECGEEFAENMRDGAYFKNAWHDALQELWTENDGAVAASGNSETECNDRLDHMKWSNFQSYAPRRGTSVTNLCAHWWSNL